MYTFNELRKAAKYQVDAKEIRLAVLGNCATQFLSASIQGYGKLSGINLNVMDADYDQMDAQLLDPLSETYKFKPDSILLWISTEKLYEEFLDMEKTERTAFAEACIGRITRYWELISQNAGARILQANFSEIDDKAFGNYSCKVEESFLFQMRKLNFLLGQSMTGRGDVYPVDLLSIQIQLGQKQYGKAALYYSSKIPVAMEAYPYVAKAVVDVLNALEGKIKKCVVCDLDNTLWGGVIGDDGLGGIEIGELGRGHAFTNFQRWLKQLKDHGIILAVCSKNEEAAAREPFEKHEEMVLRLSDISVFVANWEDKASNIRLIQQSLNIGMDSIVFLDDNVFERELVRRMIPDIEVPELPEDPALYVSYLQECNYFETASCTPENQDRTRMYQEEFERKKLERTFENLDDYLKSLEMHGAARPFEPVRFARIAQLTQRSNQFNLRTVRYTEDDIKRISEDEGYLTLYFTLKDRLGDYGLVSVVMMKKTGEKEAFIDTWLTSCRVLKRGMEEYAVNHMVETARKHGIKTLLAEYIPTDKNKMVSGLYRAMGFEETGRYQYRLCVDDYKEKMTYIAEETDNGEK